MLSAHQIFSNIWKRADEKEDLTKTSPGIPSAKAPGSKPAPPPTAPPALPVGDEGLSAAPQAALPQSGMGAEQLPPNEIENLRSVLMELVSDEDDPLHQNLPKSAPKPPQLKPKPVRPQPPRPVSPTEQTETNLNNIFRPREKADDEWIGQAQTQPKGNKTSIIPRSKNELDPSGLFEAAQKAPKSYQSKIDPRTKLYFSDEEPPPTD